MNYNYREEMLKDVTKCIYNDYYAEAYEIETREELHNFVEKLKEDLLTNDNITGCAGGSYTNNSGLAKDYVTSNKELVKSCIHSQDDMKDLLDYYINEDWKAIDVYIRCSLLSQVIDDWIGRF